MRARPWLFAAAFVVLVAAAAAVSYWSRWGLAGIVVAAMAGLVLTRRCTHRYATLLPPVRDAGPDRDHARWYCDRCGRTWDAHLESTTHPRVIYTGYDEHKAVKAAARAEGLDKQRRRLADKRAGGSRRRPMKPAVVAQRTGPRPVETVLDQRAVGDTTRTFSAVRTGR